MHSAWENSRTPRISGVDVQKLGFCFYAETYPFDREVITMREHISRPRFSLLMEWSFRWLKSSLSEKLSLLGSIGSILALALAIVWTLIASPSVDPPPPPLNSIDVSQTLERLLSEPGDYSLDERLKEIAAEQDTIPQALKNEIEKWIADAKTPYEKGLSALYRGSYREAKTHFTAEVDLQKQDLGKQYLVLGKIYLRQGELELAIEAYKNAVSMAPTDARAHYGLARAYALKNEVDLAISSLRDALKLDEYYIETSKMDAAFAKIRD
jgi:tetratricopeptide (TPR) repeat protein